MIMGKNFLTELRAQLLSSGNKEMANRQTMERRKCNVMMVTGDADKGTHTGEIYYDGDNSNKTINATSFFSSLSQLLFFKYICRVHYYRRYYNFGVFRRTRTLSNLYSTLLLIAFNFDLSVYIDSMRSRKERFFSFTFFLFPA